MSIPFSPKNYSKQPTTNPKAHGAGPKWTFKELAERWGLTQQQLSALIMRNPGFPVAGLRYADNASGSGSRQYYDLRQALLWYKSTQQSLKEDIKYYTKMLNSMK